MPGASTRSVGRACPRAHSLFLGIVWVLTLLATHAAAQERAWNPYGLEVYREGPGFKLGQSALVVHPGVSLEAGYDSNVYYQPTRPIDSAVLRLRLHLDLAPLPIDPATGSTADPKVDFRLSTQLEYREYLSTNATIRSARSFNALLSGFVTLFPRGKVSLRFDEDFIRSVDPRDGEGPVNFARVYNRFGVTVTGRPGGGRLEVGAGDSFIVQRFDDADVAFGNSLQNDARLFARFKIFSRTILSAVAHVGYVYYNNSPTLETVPLRLIVEVSSPVTSWLEGTLALGYGGSIALRSKRLETAISQEELRFLLPLGIRIVAGHKRDFSDSIFASYYTDDVIYVGYQQPFLKRLRAFADAQVHFRHYDGLLDPTNFGYQGYSSTERDDLLYEAHAGLSVQVLRWLVVRAVYNLLADHTSFDFLRTDGTSLNASYIKHSVFAGVDLAY